jgi:apolipoprotein N-acyltransferase
LEGLPVQNARHTSGAKALVSRARSARLKSCPDGSSAIVLAVLSGLLLVLSFPKFDLYPLSAVALVPLIFVTGREAKAGRRFLGGSLAGFVFFAGTSTWIYMVMRDFGGLGIPAAGGVLGLLCLILSLYWGCFAWLAGYLWCVRWGPLAAPFLWVALELARGHLFTGYPWLLLGYALTDYPGLARLASWTGVYGLSFLVISFNVAWAWLWIERSGERAFPKCSTTFLTALLAVTLLLWATATEETYSEDRKAFLVQTNIPQEVAFSPWTPEAQKALFDRLEILTTDAVGRQETPALVIWPEMPASFYFFDDGFTRPFMEGIARRMNSFFLTGIVAFVPGSNRTQPLNSNVLLDPSGTLLAQYDKIHLVPFGEYIPWSEWLGFAESLTAETGDFVSGSRYVVTEALGGRVSSIICYEAIFPELSRRFVQEGAELLVNISNDGWFGNSAARYQHLLMARMRAIENARYLLRTTNTGITVVIRPDGQIASEIPPDRPGVLEGQWSFQTRRTFYTRYGDWFAYLACLASLIALAAARGRGQKAGRG